jgi:phenylalanyl-tRNA synthetase beta chain
MPKIDVSLKDLEMLAKRPIAVDDLDQLLLQAKAEFEGVDQKTGMLKIDIKDTNRPDLWSVEGIARQLRGYLGVEKGCPNYKINKGHVKLKIDKSVQHVRPLMVAAVVKGLSFDDFSIQQIIQLQEKIALTWGRKRREAAIGIYDCDKLTSSLRYTTFKDNEIKFVPLDSEAEMSPKQILSEHPKGREYGHLIQGEYFPILIDDKGNVCSMPPVINSAWTGKITADTKNVFVECTGYNLRIINVALNVIVTALAERGGKIESVVLMPPTGKESTMPNLDSKTLNLNPENARRFLGLQLSDDQIVNLLRQYRYDVKKSGKVLACSYPAYRDDIIHERDLAEDVAIAFGYNDLRPDPPKIHTIGGTLPIGDFFEKARELMVGLGFQEILTFVLTNKENLFSKMNSHEFPIAEIANPISANWTALRHWLLPSMLEFLSKNGNNSYPQRVFEVGDCVIVDEKEETKTRTTKKLVASITDSKVGYEQVVSVLDAFMRNTGLKYELTKTPCAYCIEGRVAEMVVDGRFVGVVGEIHPQVLNNWNLEKSVVTFELSLDEIWNLLKK